ncbi:MAG TPA: pyridoxal-phosphate dependent enzyme [Gemmatimonadaceae bacterium]|nr:pyridoxal-phosphate dependent enzyme [Gemmatimonadaceae bacterium]
MQRFPALADVPRAHLGQYPSPVTAYDGKLWIKRDDLNAPELGGNKVRSLEWLLGGLTPGETILTAGGDGSTHVLATATHAARLGARTVAVRWRHEMHPVADAVARRSAAACDRTIRTATVPGAFLRLAMLRATIPDCRYIPPGGATALGTLGHVAAGLELAGQITAGQLPEPSIVVVPLGTGATAAGLALGLGIAGVGTRVVAARVVPRIALAGRRVRRLIDATRRLLAERAGVQAGSLPAVPVELDHSVYGGAYGRPLPDAAQLDGLTLDPTYSAKAATVANARKAGPVLFWLTFDGRWL